MLFIAVLAFGYFSGGLAGTTGGCPVNSTRWNNECFHFRSDTAGFAQAEAKCNEIDGHLASLHDAFANSLLAQEAYKRFDEQADFWIGATKLIFKQQKTWNWTDGSSVDFLDWDNGEPSTETDYSCVAVAKDDGYWSAQNCYQQKPYVCATSALPTYPSEANCSVGWSYFPPTHSCYGAGWGGLVETWNHAQVYCENASAHLPSIHSVAEFQYIESYVYAAGTDFWTGIFTADGGAIWKSADGTKADFLNYGPWCSGYPKDIPGESCVLASYDAQGSNSTSCYYNTACTSVFRRTLCKQQLF